MFNPSVLTTPRLSAYPSFLRRGVFCITLIFPSCKGGEFFVSLLYSPPAKEGWQAKPDGVVIEIIPQLNTLKITVKSYCAKGASVFASLFFASFSCVLLFFVSAFLFCFSKSTFFISVSMSAVPLWLCKVR